MIVPIEVESQMLNTTGLEIILHPLFTQEHQSNHMRENMVIEAVPISSFPPEQVEGSTGKKRRRKSSEVNEEIIEKDFSLLELYKTTNINEINLCKEINGHEATIDPQELLKNLNGWKIKRRGRVGTGNVRTDQFYCHDILSKKRTLRSLVEVKRCIEENSYHRKDSDDQEGSKVEQIKGKSLLTENIGQVDNDGRVEEMVKDNKLPRKSKPIKCSKCHNQGHNSRTCKGQPATCYS